MGSVQKQASPLPLMAQWKKPQQVTPAFCLNSDHYKVAVKEVGEKTDSVCVPVIALWYT